MSNVSDMNISSNRIERKRNERERRRVQGINQLLVALKDKLPADWTTPKMSKLEILRKSTSYIKLLMEMSLDEESEIPHKVSDESACEFQDQSFSGSSNSSTGSVGTLLACSGELPVASNSDFVLSDSLENGRVHSEICFPTSSGQSVSLERSPISHLFTCKYQQTIPTQEQCVPAMENKDTDLAALHDSGMPTMY
ncbi:uncharacterized protein LOC132553081 [Ylistrum balloti]|uniref:uncharacterized protein LOC132553081 n=1 Tax=Ylistrum balloti TaxID=509963 RepID=UPI002905C2B1|nr:uncharacterized protein LOC132553081 [Ylistrum balloti]